MTYMSILLYADDIQLVAPSVTSLHRILSICEAELESLDMRVNPKKSSCIRFGARFSVKCSNISTVDNCKLSFSHAKQSMYRAFNAVFGKNWANCTPGCCTSTCEK